MKKNILCFGLLFFFLQIGISAQSPYAFDWKKESIIIGTSAIIMGTGYVIHANLDPLSEETIANLSRSAINSFDIGATYNFSSSADGLSDIGLTSSYILPALFLAHKTTRRDFKSIAILYGETMLATKSLTNITKRTIKRVRPFVYNENVPIAIKSSWALGFHFSQDTPPLQQPIAFSLQKCFLIIFQTPN